MSCGTSEVVQQINQLISQAGTLLDSGVEAIAAVTTLIASIQQQNILALAELAVFDAVNGLQSKISEALSATGAEFNQAINELKETFGENVNIDALINQIDSAGSNLCSIVPNIQIVDGKKVTLPNLSLVPKGTPVEEETKPVYRSPVRSTSGIVTTSSGSAVTSG